MMRAALGIGLLLSGSLMAFADTVVELSPPNGFDDTSTFQVALDSIAARRTPRERFVLQLSGGEYLLDGYAANDLGTNLHNPRNFPNRMDRSAARLTDAVTIRGAMTNGSRATRLTMLDVPPPNEVAAASVFPHLFGNELSGQFRNRSLQSVHFENIVFRLPRNSVDTLQSRGFVFKDARDISFTNCRFENAPDAVKHGYALLFHGVNRVTIRDCQFVRVSGGVGLEYCRDVEISGCEFRLCSEAIDIDKVNTRVEISGNTFRNLSSVAIDANASSRIAIFQNHFERCERVFFANGKRLIGASLKKHAQADVSDFLSGRDIRFGKRNLPNTVLDCPGDSATTPAFVIGNNYLAPHDDFRPANSQIRGLVFDSNVFMNTNFFAIHDGEVRFSRNMFDNVGQSRSAIQANCQFDHIGNASKLKLILSDNSFTKLRYGIAEIRQATTITIQDSRVSSANLHAGTAPFFRIYDWELGRFQDTRLLARRNHYPYEPTAGPYFVKPVDGKSIGRSRLRISGDSFVRP